MARTFRKPVPFAINNPSDTLRVPPSLAQGRPISAAVIAVIIDCGSRLLASKRKLSALLTENLSALLVKYNVKTLYDNTAPWLKL